MMNPLDSFTVERLEALSEGQKGFGLAMASYEESMLLAKIALAAKQAKPVAEVYQPANIGICAALGPSIRMINIGLPAGNKLYATPPLNYPEIPEGWVVVQASPTQEMVDACFEATCNGGIQKGYRAMLAAAPKPE